MRFVGCPLSGRRPLPPMKSPSARRSAPILPIGLESPTARRGGGIAAAGHIAATPVKVGRKVDFGVRETPVGDGAGGGSSRLEIRMGTLVEATPVKKALSPFGIFGKRADDEYEGGGVDDVGGKSIYDVWNDDDYEELA